MEGLPAADAEVVCWQPEANAENYGEEHQMKAMSLMVRGLHAGIKGLEKCFLDAGAILICLGSKKLKDPCHSGFPVFALS